MDPSSAEFVASRVVAVFALERLIHERSAPFVWGFTILAVLAWVGAIASAGVVAVLLGLVALVLSAVAATLFVVRKVVVRGIRRVGGGRDYGRLRPLVKKRIEAVEDARGAVPMGPLGFLRLAWMARRPKALQDHVRETAQTVVRTIPEVVADVRRELAGPVVDI